ncbi:MAG: hypothetical protein HY369_02715 [Candidatus Aenigmarchaeota archaeon]|nr:hypothetical protein [Candidatus Aenigmarchaeota archaeon]
MFKLFRREKPRKRRPSRQRDTSDIKDILRTLSTKDDVSKIVAEVTRSREMILNRMADKDLLPRMLAEHVTAPLREAISLGLSSSQAVKQSDRKRLSASQAAKSLDEVVLETKQKIEMLTPRHLKVLQALAEQRDWLTYEGIGSLCAPPVSGSCIRGYVADLVNVYKIPLEKMNAGRQTKVRISEKTLKEFAITKLSD